MHRVVPLALLAACAPEPDLPSCVACELTDANNFRYTADLSVDVVPARALSDVTVQWSALTRDIQGHALDPATDIVRARLVAFRDTAPEGVAEGLANDTLFQSAVTLYVLCTPEEASCTLSEFGIGGSAIDVSEYFSEGSATWLLALSRANEAGASAMVFLDPRADGAESVAIGDDTSRLRVDVDFESLAPIRVPARDDALLFDWSGLTADGLGNPLNLAGIDGVVVARYDAPLAALESDVFDLFTATDDVWTASTSERAIDLSTLAGPRPFPGVDVEGTWLFALTCSSCTNPTPRFVTVLEAAP